MAVAAMAVAAVAKSWQGNVLFLRLGYYHNLKFFFFFKDRGLFSFLFLPVAQGAGKLLAITDGMRFLFYLLDDFLDDFWHCFRVHCSVESIKTPACFMNDLLFLRFLDFFDYLFDN